MASGLPHPHSAFGPAGRPGRSANGGFSASVPASRQRVPPIISTRQLTKRFEGGVLAVDRLDLDIEPGEVFGLLGPNGAGKTTFINMLCTLLTPTSGTVELAGIDVVAHPSEVRKEIGIVFQEPSVDDLLTGRENLQLHGRLYGMSAADRTARIALMLELVGLKERADEPVRDYSGGMRRRLEIARGLMHRPKVLFLDEPTLGLDPQSREHIWKYVLQLARTGTTIVLTTHYMEEADLLCSRIGIVDKGRIVVLGTASELKAGVGQDVVRLKGALDLAKVRRLRFVQRAERKEDGFAYVTIAKAAENLQALLKACGKLESVEVRQVSLNDVFLHYTGRSMDRDEEGEGGWSDRAMQWGTRRD